MRVGLVARHSEFSAEFPVTHDVNVMCDKVSVWNLISLPAELPHSLQSQAFTYQPVQCA